MAALYLQASGLAPRAGAGEETRPGADQRAARRHFGDENSGAVRRHTLFSQALFGNLKGTRELLDRGAEADATETGNGATPLMAAARFGFVEIARALIRHGADVNKLGPEGTPLALALQHGHSECARLLISHGARRSDTDRRRPSVQYRRPLERIPGTSYCDNCGVCRAPNAEAYVTCGACARATYCSRHCEAAHAKTHSPYCAILRCADASGASTRKGRDSPRRSRRRREVATGG